MQENKRNVFGSQCSYCRYVRYTSSERVLNVQTVGSWGVESILWSTDWRKWQSLAVRV